MPNLNQLINILSQNLTMNKARLMCLALITLAIIQVQSSNLKQIARGFVKGRTNSNYRRLQRFFAQVDIDQDQLAKFIYQLFDLDEVIISIDRTNWKWGKKNINIFLLSVVHQGIAIPLYWTLLDKKGNSNSNERCELIQKFINTFGADKIQYVLADREFVGKEWFQWLNKEQIKFCIRIKHNTLVANHQGKLVQIKTLLRHLSPHETFMLARAVPVYGVKVRLFAKRDADNDYVIIATNNLDHTDAMALYSRRWEIETLFSCFKGRGFNLEDTHLTQLDRVSKLVAVCALAFCWSYRIGINTVQQHPKRRKLKKHGRPQQSLFAIGLDVLIDGLREYFFAGNRRVFEVLISYLSPSPRPLRL